MRAAPTVTLYDDVFAVGCVSQPGYLNGIAATAARVGQTGFSAVNKTTGNYAQVAPVVANWIADARL
jgi:hypothetical protein